MNVSTKGRSPVGWKLRLKDVILALCGASLVIASSFLFFHHSSALDRHIHHMHAKPLFSAHDVGRVPFRPANQTASAPQLEPSPSEPAEVDAEAGKDDHPVLGKNATPAAGSALVRKDLNFSVSPKCKSLIISASSMMKQWSKALAELDRPTKILTVNQLAVKKFYSISYGVVTISVGGVPMSYTIIWKCANDAIRKNMMVYEKSRPMVNPKHVSAKVLEQVESHSLAQYSKKMRTQYGLSSYPKSFTFAREPISHFISGISEYYWRNYQTSKVSTEDLKKKLDGMFEFRQLTERKDSITDKWQKYVLWHFYAMSGILRVGYNIGYLGKLESFDEDWKIINGLYGANVKINRSLGWHESSDDPNGVKAAFKDLFKRDVRYKRALCQLLYADYVCFKYELPPECQNLPKPSENEIQKSLQSEASKKSSAPVHVSPSTLKHKDWQA